MKNKEYFLFQASHFGELWVELGQTDFPFLTIDFLNGFPRYAYYRLVSDVTGEVVAKVYNAAKT